LSTKAVPAREKFDTYSQDYEALVATSTRLFGEEAAYFARAKAEFLARQVSTAFSGKILDYGCGIGLLSRALASRFGDAVVHGFDPSPGSFAAVPAELRARGCFSTDPSKLDRDYDVVVLANVMHHVPVRERSALIRSLRDRVAPCGCVVAFEHNPANPLTRSAVAHCPFDDDAVLLWPGELKQHFLVGGFSQVKRQYVTFFPRLLAGLRGFEPLLGWCPLGGQYAVIASK
jgi:2-polyprenyl-3-methyl-5-hydroxy-6-metoxy-1,4-benzoquinol methylase